MRTYPARPQVLKLPRNIRMLSKAGAMQVSQTTQNTEQITRLIARALELIRLSIVKSAALGSDDGDSSVDAGKEEEEHNEEEKGLRTVRPAIGPYTQ